MCGKRCYTSKHQARLAVKNMHETVRVYPCGPCGGAWHTTQERYSSKNHKLARSWNSRKSRGRRNQEKNI